MKIIRRVVDLNEANIIVGFLRANDIDARALDGATHSLIPTSYGIRIAVADKDELRAQELLNTINADMENRNENDE